MTALAENLERLEEAIAAACRRAGRTRDEVELMAVAKTYPAATVAAAAGLGLRLFGESRVQEFAAKAAELEGLRRDSADPIRVHLIGHLQSNKAARTAELFDAVDSVDSVRLAGRLNEAAGELGKRVPILIEIKLSPEGTKAGLEPESGEAAQLLEALPGFHSLQVRGLMTIAPWGGSEDVTRGCFRSLRSGSRGRGRNDGAGGCGWRDAGGSRAAGGEEDGDYGRLRRGSGGATEDCCSCAAGGRSG